MDRTSVQLTPLGSYLYVERGRRGLVNPGNRRTPTPYYMYTYEVQEALRRKVGFYRSTPTYEDVYPFDLPSPLSGAVGPGRISEYGWKTGLDGGRSYAFVPDGTLSNEAYSRALGRLLSDVKKQKMTDFNVGVFAAEANESIRMIGNAASRIYQSLRALKRGDIPGLYDALSLRPGSRPRGRWVRGNGNVSSNSSISKDLSSAWLEASLGWRPLIRDVYSGAEKIASLVAKQPPLLSSKGRAAVRSAVTQTVPYHTTSGTITTYRMARAEIACRYTVGNSIVTDLSSLGLTNPSEVAWELVPLSFVVDWFLPVGNFLSNLSAFHGYNFLNGYVTITGSEVIVTQCPAVDIAREFTWMGVERGFVLTRLETLTSGSYTVRKFGMSRSLLTQFPAPEPPRLQWSSVSLSKALTSLSLLRTLAFKS